MPDSESLVALTNTITFIGSPLYSKPIVNGLQSIGRPHSDVIRNRYAAANSRRAAAILIGRGPPTRGHDSLYGLPRYCSVSEISFRRSCWSRMMALASVRGDSPLIFEALAPSLDLLVEARSVVSCNVVFMF